MDLQIIWYMMNTILAISLITATFTEVEIDPKIKWVNFTTILIWAYKLFEFIIRG